jgi:hypothetical protein
MITLGARVGVVPVVLGVVVVLVSLATAVVLVCRSPRGERGLKQLSSRIRGKDIPSRREARGVFIRGAAPKHRLGGQDQSERSIEPPGK